MRRADGACIRVWSNDHQQGEVGGYLEVLVKVILTLCEHPRQPHRRKVREMVAHQVPRRVGPEKPILGEPDLPGRIPPTGSPAGDGSGTETEDPATGLEVVTDRSEVEQPVPVRSAAKTVAIAAARSHGLLKKRPVSIAPPPGEESAGSYDSEIMR
jgi:hypothetical protein